MLATRSKSLLVRLGLILAGVGLSLGIVEVGMRLTGAYLVQARRQRARDAVRDRHELRVLCLGESTTDGTEAHGRYPAMLEEILNRQRFEGRVAVVNRGRSGAVTDDILQHLDRDLEQFQPDIVVTMMGVNDAGRTHAYGSVIAPGADRWYGSFRVYKLFRLLRDAFERGFGPPPGENPEILLDALGRPEPGAALPLPEITPEAGPELAAALELAVRLAGEGETDAAIGALARLRDENPEVSLVYIRLAEVLARADRNGESIALLEAAIDTVPRPTAGLYTALALAYTARGETARAVPLLRHVVDHVVDPSDLHEQAHYRLVLAWAYEDDDQLDRAEETWRSIVELEEGNDAAYQPLIEFYERHDNAALASHYRTVQERIRNDFVNPRTRHNYRALRDRLAAAGIRLVAAQYPMRRVEVLRRKLGDDAEVIFVDNGFFRELVARDGYGAYFTDRFAGDFGHLTEQGNRLLAENIARVITEEHFGVPFAALPVPAGGE